ncbi:nucleotidyltransferase domain-containing protein [Natronococcus pandeyae]|nr:nucleotidyltransferase family protein [Natronococcus pandeyae]
MIENYWQSRRWWVDRSAIDYPSNPSLEFVVRSVLADRAAECDRRLHDLSERSDLNWETVERIARFNQIVPPVYKGIAATCPDRVPKEVLSALRGRYRTNAVRNRYLVGELLEILEQFESRGIRAIPYKGAVLARAVYDDLDRRTFVDADLLVAKEDLAEAASTLTELGYRWFDAADERQPPLGPVIGGPLVPPLTDEWKFDGGDAVVEVGWQLHRPSAPIDLPFDDLWERSVSTSLSGDDVPSLSPIDRLLVLAHHGSRHQWARLKWICDFAEAVRAEDRLPWHAVVKRAKAAGIERRLRIALGLSMVLFDCPKRPVARRIAVDDDRAVALVGKILDRYWTDPLGDPGAAATYLFDVCSTDSIDDALVAATGLLRPTLAEYRRVPLPRTLYPLYYLVRPLRLLGREITSTSEHR